MSMKGDNFSWIEQALLAVIEFLSVSVFDWSLFSHSVFMSKPVSGRCLGSLALLCEFAKGPIGRMNCRKVNFLGRHGSPIHGMGCTCSPYSLAQLIPTDLT